MKSHMRMRKVNIYVQYSREQMAEFYNEPRKRFLNSNVDLAPQEFANLFHRTSLRRRFDTELQNSFEESPRPAAMLAFSPRSKSIPERGLKPTYRCCFRQLLR